MIVVVVVVSVVVVVVVVLVAFLNRDKGRYLVWNLKYFSTKSSQRKLILNENFSRGGGGGRPVRWGVARYGEIQGFRCFNIAPVSSLM